MMLLPSKENNLIMAEGVQVLFIDTLAKVFNFTYSLVDNKHKWGQKLPNSSWDGIVGMVHRQVIH